MILTGMVSSLLFSLIFGMFAATSTDFDLRDSSGAFSAILSIAMLGVFVAIPAALVIGLLIELPKARWLSRRTGHFATHVGSSWMLAVILAAIFVAATPSGEGLVPSREGAGGLIFVFAAFSVGGITSAVIWWFLVVKRWRLSRFIP